MKNHKFITIFVIGLILAVAGFLIRDAYISRVLILLTFNIILGSSINLLAGYTGQISLAHAGFYGIGAYVSAVLSTKLGLSFWIVLPLSFIVTSIFGILLGMPTLRLKGHYLTIATLAFCMMTYIIIQNWDPVTNGPIGILGIEAPKIFNLSLDQGYLYLPFAIVFATIIIAAIVAILDSSYGRAFLAIREDEISAEVSGVNTYFYKVLIFAISAGIAGMAGSLYAHFAGFISPESYDVSHSISILTISIVGGIGTVIGPIVGAVWLTFLSEALRSAAELEQIIYGIMLVAVIVFMPRGIYPTVSDFIKMKVVKNTTTHGKKE